MNIDSSFLSYFINAGIIVKLVMFLLMGASVISWMFILQRGLYLKWAHTMTKQFESKFWAGGDLATLYSDSLTRKDNLSGIEAVFQAGFKEFLRLYKHTGMTATAITENVQRAMRGTQMREQDKLEMHLAILATVGSISPYVGLFGTVWGIMLSFGALAHVQQATISMVAPGIAEALIATALGLFAAIPAVFAYNRYATEVNRLLNRFDAFQDEFTNILFRQAQLNLPKTEAVME